MELVVLVSSHNTTYPDKIQPASPEKEAKTQFNLPNTNNKKLGYNPIINNL